MKLYILLALFALAAASPLHVDHAEVEPFNRPSKEEIIDAIRRLIERILDRIRNQSVSDSPIVTFPITDADIYDIVDVINSPITKPEIVAALRRLLERILAVIRPQNVPVITVPIDQVQVYDIIDVINKPTKPEIVAALRRLLERILEWIRSQSESPVHVEPAWVDEYQPPHVDPVYVEDYKPETVAAPPRSPLVQIIVNVKNAQDVGSSPVVVEGLEPAFPEIVAELPSPVPEIVAELPSPVPEFIDIMPVPVEEVEVAELPSPVEVAELPTPVEPVNVAPIVIDPVQVAPEILN